MGDAGQSSDQAASMIRLLLVDDDLFVRSSLADLLPRSGPIKIVGALADGSEAVAAVGSAAPDVILMDVSMPGMDGMEATRRIHALEPGIRILALTSMADRATVANMQAAGASGYLFKDTPVAVMAKAIEAAHLGLIVMSRVALPSPLPAGAVGLPRLTEVETEILKLLCEGLTNPQIASRVSLAPSTVKHYVSLLMDRVGASNRTQLAIIAGPHFSRQ